MADPLLWKDFDAVDPRAAALRSGARVADSGTIEIDIFNRTFTIDPDSRKIHSGHPSFDGDHEPRLEIPLLKYLSEANPVTLSGVWVSPRDLPGGAQFFTGTHGIPVNKIIAKFGSDRDLFSIACKKLGGEPVAFGDVGFVLRLFPLFPVQVILWLGDDEFPARASMLVDKNAHLQMPLDAVLSALMYVEYSIANAK
jgi:hypothetical protein